MNSEYYKNEILKTAAEGKKLSTKAKIGLAGAGALASGVGYSALSDKNKKKVKEGSKNATNVANNKLKQSLLAITGGLAGTGLSLKRGRSLKRSVATGGLAGAAAGDILGSAIIPTRDLYKKHKKEFGTAPDKKDVAKVMAANVIPTAGLWGVIGTSKRKRARYAKENAEKIKKTKDSYKKFSENMNNTIKAQTERQNRGYDEHLRKNPNNPLSPQEWRASEEGLKYSQSTPEEIKAIYGSGKNIATNTLKLLTTNPLNAMGKPARAVGATAFLASPRAIVEKKKKRILEENKKDDDNR